MSVRILKSSQVLKTEDEVKVKAQLLRMVHSLFLQVFVASCYMFSKKEMYHQLEIRLSPPGGGIPHEPDFLEQRGLQDHHQRGHHLPGLNPDCCIPNVNLTLQKYGPLEDAWDSQRLATQMLRKFQAFANKVSTFMLINDCRWHSNHF